MTKAIVALFVVSFFAHLLFGCAHVTPIVTACVANPQAVDTVLADLQQDGWQAKLDALAKAIGPCVVRAAVQQVIDALSGGLALSEADAGVTSNEDVVSRGRAWLTANPN